MTEALYTPREYLSITTLLSFVRCPRLYFYRKSGLVPKIRGNALLYGTAMHKAIAPTLTNGLEAGMEAFTSVWDDSLADDKRSTARARAQLTHFAHVHSANRSLYTFEKPPPLPEGFQVTDDRSPYEIPAVIDVGLPVPIVVFIDGWVRHRDTGELWGYEFKTTSRLDSKLFEALEFHPQVLFYTLALKTVSGAKVRGMMAEAMLIDKTKVDSITQPVLVQDHQLESILRWVQYYGALLLECEERYKLTGNVEHAFPKNFSGCSAYPHYYIPSFSCDYMNLCRAPGWEMLKDLYDVVPDHKYVTLTTGGK